MITPRFATVAFVALLGIVNVSGLPVWPQQIVRVCCAVFDFVYADGFVSAPCRLCRNGASRRFNRFRLM